MSHLKASYPVLSSIPRVIIVSNNRYIYTETHVLTIRARLASVYIASVARRSIHQLVHTLDITSNSPAWIVVCHARVRSWIGFACTHETRRPSPNTWLKAPMRKLMAFLPKCNVFSFLPSVNFHEYENYLDFSCRYIPAFRFYPWLCSSNYSFDLDKTDSEIYKLYLWKKYEIMLKENFRSFSQRLVLSFPLR